MTNCHKLFHDDLGLRGTCFHFSSSDDGYFTTTASAQAKGGEWKVEAVSISKYHGLRSATPQTVLRTMPLEAKFKGVPDMVREGEILTSFNLTMRNNMPIKINVSSKVIIFWYV